MFKPKNTKLTVLLFVFLCNLFLKLVYVPQLPPRWKAEKKWMNELGINVCLVYLLSVFPPKVFWGNILMYYRERNPLHSCLLHPLLYFISVVSVTANNMLWYVREVGLNKLVPVHTKYNHLSWMSLIGCVNLQSWLERSQSQALLNTILCILTYNCWWCCCTWFRKHKKCRLVFMYFLLSPASPFTPACPGTERDTSKHEFEQVLR